MKPLNILCDLDGIAADLLSDWIGAYNKEYNRSVTVDDVTEWKLDKCPKVVHGKAIFKYLQIPGFYENLKPIPGAVQGLKELTMIGHEILIITAIPARAEVAAEKLKWVKKHLPFIPQNNIFIGHKKYVLKGDVLIDDGPHNLTMQKTIWGNSCKTCTIAYPYNRDVSNICDCYAESWKEPERAWGEITGYICDLAENS